MGVTTETTVFRFSVFHFFMSTQPFGDNWLMANLNLTITSGNLTKNPEVIVVNDTTVCKCSVAVNWKSKDSDGVDFIDFEIWGKRGEAFGKFHSKGDACFLQGSLKQNSWVDKDTNKKLSKLIVRVTDWQFAGTKKEKGSSSQDLLNLVLELGLNKTQQAKLKTLLSPDKADTTEVVTTDVEHTPFN